MSGVVWTLMLLLWMMPMVHQEKILSKKSNGLHCQEHSECHSHCCVRTSQIPRKFCSAKTVFLQCVAWRKPSGDYCYSHSECESLCCLSASETSSSRCTRRSGLLALCLPL
uniref:leucine-rich colipase-like protein 1 isoform X2 n=1 Tax=Jaculus jaculus TaxID=51337 RepID=UPI001E1B23AE|nr:leucine-rich colipase-like protein 1 isoform X2 [Jaculus jaculus]